MTDPVTPRSSRATHYGVTPSATSDVTFFNTTVDISRATSCGVTQILVTPRAWRDQSATSCNLVWEGLILKF
jgi:hypothetical protein